MAANKTKRTKAQRRKAALEAWQRRKAAEQLAGVPKFTPPPAVELPRAPIVPPSTATFTRDGESYFITVYQDGSFFRHRVQGSTAKLLAMDILRQVG